MIPVTLWYAQVIDKKTNSSKWVFNHLEHGHCQNDKPTAIDSKQQNIWINVVWDKKLTFATDTTPMVVED